LAFLAEEGDTFHFRYLEVNERPVSVMIREGSPTQNNLRSNAIDLENQLPAVSRGSLMTASSEPGEPEGKNAWWHWTAPLTSTIHLSTKGQQISVYQGTPQTPLNELIPLLVDSFGFGDGDIVFEAEALQSYLIAVHQKVPTPPSSRYPWNSAVELRVAKFIRSPGDRFENRIILPGQTSVRYEGIGTGATWTDQEITPCRDCNGSIWLEWTPPVSGTYVFEGQTLLAGNNDDGIGLFTMNEAGIREQLAVAIDDDDDTQSSFRFSVEANRAYYLIFFTDSIFNTYGISISPYRGFDLWVDTWRYHLEQFSNYYPEITADSLQRNSSVLRDEVTNFERYLFGMDPKIKLPWDRASSNRPTLVKLNDFLELRYRLGSQAASLEPGFMTHGGEVSIDGKTWVDVPTINLGDRWFAVRTPVDHPRKFLRFKAIEK